LRAGLRELGYVAGRNVMLELRYGDGARERLPRLATELIELKPDVIESLKAPIRPISRSNCRPLRAHRQSQGRQGDCITVSDSFLLLADEVIE
jgi:hypothetical protein